MSKRVVILALFLVLVGCASTGKCPECVCNKSAATQCQSCNGSAGITQNELDRCPKITIVKNLTFTKYVCPNGMIVDLVDDCFPVNDTNVAPVTTNEIGTFIQTVAVKPACVYGMNGGIVQFLLDSVAKDIWFQVRDTGEYKDVYHIQNLYTGNKYFVISDRIGNAEFKLLRNNIYLFRMKFRMAPNQTQYSNEHIIDTRTGSKYMLKQCSS